MVVFECPKRHQPCLEPLHFIRNSAPDKAIRPQALHLQVQVILLSAARNADKIDMSLPETQIRGLQAQENLLTAAHNTGKIDMRLSEP